MKVAPYDRVSIRDRDQSPKPYHSVPFREYGMEREGILPKWQQMRHPLTGGQIRPNLLASREMRGLYV